MEISNQFCNGFVNKAFAHGFKGPPRHACNTMTHTKANDTYTQAHTYVIGILDACTNKAVMIVNMYTREGTVGCVSIYERGLNQYQHTANKEANRALLTASHTMENHLIKRSILQNTTLVLPCVF
jgi:hypothetical protein